MIAQDDIDVKGFWDLLSLWVCKDVLVDANRF